MGVRLVLPDRDIMDMSCCVVHRTCTGAAVECLGFVPMPLRYVNRMPVCR